MSSNVLPFPNSGRSQSQSRPTVYCGEFAFLVLVCLIITVIEGLTRGGNVVYAEISEIEILAVGWIFALITLPLVFMYSKAVGASRSEATLLWLILGTVTYSKDFAYTHLPGTPLYVTDLVLAACVYWNREGLLEVVRSLGKWKTGALAGFVVAGMIATARGVLSGQELMKVARDAELFLYSAFLLLAIAVFKTWASILRAMAMGVLGACLCSVNAFAWFITNPGGRRYIPYPMYVLAALTALLILRMRGMKNYGKFSLIALLALGLVLANARTTYVGFVGCLGLVVLIGAYVWRGAYLQILKPIVSMFLLAIVLLVALYQTDAGRSFIGQNAEELISGTINYQDDPNASFRFLAWLEAYNRFSENPAFGEGYGVPFIFELSDADPRPHNTFLTILYKMGVVGFLPFATFLGMIFIWGYRTLLRRKNTVAATWLLVLLIAEVSFCMFGFLNLMLESPFLASMFWLFLGVTCSLILQMESHSTVATAAA